MGDNNRIRTTVQASVPYLALVADGLFDGFRKAGKKTGSDQGHGVTVGSGVEYLTQAARRLTLELERRK